MKTISKWLAIGTVELIFCFWLLGNAANLVSSTSNFKVWCGVISYVFGIVIIPGTSIGYVGNRLYDARTRQKQLKQAFPDDETSLVKLLDTKEKK